MEPESLLPHSPVPTTCLYPKPAQPSPYPTSYFLIIHLNIILPSTPRSPQWSVSFRFLYQNPVYASPFPNRATCPAHHILLDFITRTLLGEEYRLLRSSLCSFLHSIVTSSLLYPNILLIPYSQIPWTCVPASMSATKFHTHTELRRINYLIYFWGTFKITGCPLSRWK
jgi:hypothetical protein